MAKAASPRRILAIETSCDETAAAIVQEGQQILSSVVYSQIPMHQPYGGVVPEIASRAHVQQVDVVVRLALEEAGLSLRDLSAIAVTQGPGLVGALLVGVSYAKGLAYGLNLPLIAVNHIAGHIAANHLVHPQLKKPYLCLVVSGGHSHLVSVKEDGFHLVGASQDDAAGEAFDKAARVLGLPYPGGPNLDQLARDGDQGRFRLPQPKLSGSFDFSFSGLKTAFINLVHGMQQRGEDLPRADLAASFQTAVVDQLMAKTSLALSQGSWPALTLAGGVSANSLLRKRAQALCEQLGLPLYLPPLGLTGDNAAMIGAAACWQLERQEFAGLGLNAVPGLQLQFRA